MYNQNKNQIKKQNWATINFSVKAQREDKQKSQSVHDWTRYIFRSHVSIDSYDRTQVNNVFVDSLEINGQGVND